MTALAEQYANTPYYVSGEWFPGWYLIGSFPPGEPDGVGSWLLHHNGEAMLLEVPPGLRVSTVWTALVETKSALKFITASHDHEDHLDAGTWDKMQNCFPNAELIAPQQAGYYRLLHLSGEPIWLLKARKHSMSDMVTVFRGVAMTGDIELGTLESVNDEVPLETKRRSMTWLRDFQWRTGYYVHTVVSAHLNDIRTNVNWESLFDV